VSDQLKKTERVNCFECRHFYVTWDPSMPKGCRAMGFKGPAMPSVMVLRMSGKPCLLFDRKAPA